MVSNFTPVLKYIHISFPLSPIHRMGSTPPFQANRSHYLSTLLVSSVPLSTGSSMHKHAQGSHYKLISSLLCSFVPASCQAVLQPPSCPNSKPPIRSSTGSSQALLPPPHTHSPLFLTDKSTVTLAKFRGRFQILSSPDSSAAFDTDDCSFPPSGNALVSSLSSQCLSSYLSTGSSLLSSFSISCVLCPALVTESTFWADLNLFCGYKGHLSVDGIPISL